MQTFNAWKIWVWSAAVCGLLLAATAAAQPKQEHVPAVIDMADALQDILLQHAASVQSPLQQQVLSFYLARDFRPAWTDSGESLAVRSALVQAADQGLNPFDYAVHAADGAAHDLALTEALFRYAHDVQAGRFRPREIYRDTGLPARDFDPGPALEVALDKHEILSFLDSLPPQHMQYRQLAAGLARYRAIAALGGWPHVTNENDLAARLSLEDSELAATPQPSPEEVRTALMRFQARNGLNPTGKLDSDTMKQLNVPVTQRIRQLAANMERWRWLPPRLEQLRVVVNVPDQSLDVIDGGEVLLHSRVIIGKKTSPTPILRTEAVAVVANPSWDIPDDIAARALVPHLRQNANYLTSRNMSLMDAPPGIAVDWRKVSGTRLPYQIRQAPGPGNVLGTLMLDSPNDFDVYMHDTPAKALFAQAQRTASNGCVRVEQIGALAIVALGGDKNPLSDALASRETRRLPLAHPLPVYMLYWTAIATPDGGVGFRPDRYGRDALLLARLDK